MWMTSTALRLLERSRPGVLATDLLACQSYADGLVDGAAIRCPVLAIIGGRDLMTPGRSAQDLLAALRDKRTLTLPRAGHSLMAEEPGAVLDALRAFL
jgi:pimeloyl-ACP methyl ester carboxylesterase